MDQKGKEVDVWLSEDGTVGAFGEVVPGGPIELTAEPVPGPGRKVAKARVNLDEIEGKTQFRLDPDSGELKAAD